MCERLSPLPENPSSLKRGMKTGGDEAEVESRLLDQEPRVLARA